MARMTDTASLPRSQADRQSDGTLSRAAASRLPDELTLIIAIEAETARLSTLVGLSAALANALHAGAASSPRQLIEFYPRESAVLLSTLSRCNRWLPDLPLTLVLSAFIGSLNRARSGTIEFASCGFTGETSALAAAWREAATSARRVADLIEQALSVYDISRDSQTALQLAEMLDHTAAGGWSGIVVDGEIAMPEWADQRATSRNPVRLPGSLERNGRTQPVIIRDISINGLGFDVEQDFAPGEIVTVRSGTEIAVQCRVVWSESGRCGAEFLQPIGEASPLLKFLDKGAPRR